MKDIGITTGCDSNNHYCPDIQTPRDQSSVFFFRGKHCPLNQSGCTYAPRPCASTHMFDDVACPPTPGAPYGDYIGELYADGITAGCGGNNFCPTLPLGTWQMLAWAQKIWPSYNPLPRDAVLTYRDQGARVITEATQSSSIGDASESVIYPRDNIFLGSQLVSSAVWAGTTPNYQFYASDHLGTPRLVTDINANLVQLRKFWPYGDDGPSSGTESFQRLKLAGMERDDESKNYYDHARVENFNTGRFLSPDLLRGNAEYPQSWNRYSYVFNNPMTLTDPWGFETNKGDNDGGGCVWNPSSGGEECTATGQLTPDLTFLHPFWPTVPGQNPGDPLSLILLSPKTLSTEVTGCNASPSTTSIVSVNATTNIPTTAGGALIGDLIGGPGGALIGGVVGSFFGVGLTGSKVPSTGTYYLGLTFVVAPALGAGNGASANIVAVPPSQNPNSIAGGLSYSLTFQPNPLFGSTITKSPGSGPPVAGPSVGTRVPVSGAVSYSVCVFNCGC